MWKVTTRGFTLEEVLIMAAMNLLVSAATTRETSVAEIKRRPRSESYGAQDYRARSTTWSGAVQSLQLLSIPFGPF
jgi:hypothetical protein